MKCLYCDQPLYQNLSLASLFKVHYDMHETCQKTIHFEPTDVIPLNGSQLVVHPLFDVDKSGNDDMLFMRYGAILMQGFKTFKADIIVYIDKDIDPTGLYLVAQLARPFLYVISLYRSNLL